MEACEICGATEGVQCFGIDYTPLCPKHYDEAKRNVEAAERDATAPNWLRRSSVEKLRRDHARPTSPA